MISFLLSLSLNGLFWSNLILVAKNITQLDLLKGQFRMSDKHGTYPNPYNLGILSNFNSIFNGDYWLFWLPLKIINENDGTEFPMIPPVTQDDIKSLP